MIDYEKLYYEFQAEIAEMIEKLEEITSQLKKFMQDSEEKVISENEEKN